MIRKPLRFVFGLFLGKKAAAVAAEVADRALVTVADKKTGGVVTKLDDLV